MSDVLLDSEQQGMIFMAIVVGLIVFAATGRKMIQYLAENPVSWCVERISGAQRPNLPKTLDRDSTSGKSLALSPKLASMFRFGVYFTSLGYVLNVTITQIISPRLTSEDCKFVAKFAFTIYCLQKLFLYSFLFAKARLVQVAMKPQHKLTNLNWATIVGIGLVISYPIASSVTFDGFKLPPFLSRKCIFKTTENFYVLFIMAALHDAAISVVLLVQFVRPLLEHIENFSTMRMPKDEDNGVAHLQQVVRVNLVFGVISMTSTVVMFSVMAWITHQKDLFLGSTVLPVCTMIDVLLTCVSVFVISSSGLWKFLCFCFEGFKVVDTTSPRQTRETRQTGQKEVIKLEQKTNTTTSSNGNKTEADEKANMI
eukprot:TRINITY_DN24061_c0_g1_i1.p1 TRINITY_DN24061_c0_g1~~TRINITY_DN24061_c0_g1_i1.p1  ORF type:complete len:385 (+),score=75.29 TRINITY_DN24061_c0_g1_i1:49-1155(+)